MKPVHHSVEIQDLPTCMYKMKNLSASELSKGNDVEGPRSDAEISRSIEVSVCV